jgi:DHA2 family multidrug resistance protein
MVTLVAFVIWEWNHPDPVVDLKLLKNRNFGTAIFLQFILGMVLFGSTVLIPQFLQVLMGYTAERAGMALSPAGFIMMLMMPVAGRLIGKMDARLLVSIGYTITALGLYNLTRLDLETSFDSIVLWRMFQVSGLAFVFIPISTLNYVGVPFNKNNQISSFSNFARNLGGSVGTAMLTTFLQRTQQVHQSTLGANIVAGSASYTNFLDSTKQSLMRLGQGSDQAAQSAVGHAYQMLLQQASMLSYMNAFWWLSVIIACLIPLPFVMRKPPAMKKPSQEAMGH